MLVAAELTAAAAALRAARVQLSSRIDATAHHSSTLSASGFAGDAAEAGLNRLTRLGGSLSEPAGRLAAAAGILEEAAAAQAALDRAREALMAVAVPPAARAAHQSAVLGMALAATLLDHACASALTQACLLEHEADVDRLAFHPDEPLESIHARHMATAPAAVQSAVADADGLILEAGPDGYTVMVGPTAAPDSITTMVAGVSSGDPAKLPGAIAQARTVADATGGAVIVWQGYKPPPNVPAGADPAAARAGADDLALFQMALDERFPGAKKMVIAHSYGTVVATRAAMEHGLFTDELVLAGSPGVPARSVDDLTLVGDNPRVTVVDSASDPIRALRGPFAAVHGYNPASPMFGATHLHGVEGGHTDYFTDAGMLEGLGRLARR